MILLGIEKPSFSEAMTRFQELPRLDLWNVVAQTAGFLDQCDTTKGSLFPKIDAMLTEYAAAMLLWREKEANLPQGLPEDSLSIPPELQVLRGVERQGVVALPKYCQFRADEWKRFEGSGAVRLANQWDALADVTSTLSEVPRKLPASAPGQ